MAQLAFFHLPPTHCRVCGRLLTDPRSITKTLGPICARNGDHTTENGDDDVPGDFTLFEPMNEGIILRRDDRGVWTNVPHVVTHHSPTGYEFGYAGSGPADLALNIVEIMLNRLGSSGERVTCWRGDCWALAYALHQEFKFQFIASAPRAGLVIPYVEVEQWIRERMPATEGL